VLLNWSGTGDGAIEQWRNPQKLKLKKRNGFWSLQETRRRRCVDWHPFSALTWLVSLSLSSLQSHSLIRSCECDNDQDLLSSIAHRRRSRSWVESWTWLCRKKTRPPGWPNCN
jgi:hypothetical protein